MNEKLTFNIPEFYNANWRDDVPEEKEAEEKDTFKFELIGGDEKGEREYISPEKVSKHAESLIRAKNKKIGQRVFALR